MTRSLLDTADLAHLRRLGGPGAAAALAACVVDSGLLQFDPDDPAWEDRDRLVIAGDGLSAAIGLRIAAAGGGLGATLPAATGGDAMGIALGAAAASELDGGGWRSWCGLDESACDDGRVWEVARAAVAARLPTLAAFVAGVSTAPLWRACGWQVHMAPADDPAWLLGAFDLAMAAPPGVVMVADGD
jgi:transketolase N-terminal domain/subunit